MCGIAGAMDRDVQRARRRVEALNRLQHHRGPDHAALAQCGPIVVGNTRLAIQDLSVAGNQPLVSRGGRYVCVFNGEIYNYRELRAQHHLEVDSNSDGAVIPALWERMGETCLKHLRGMWALAVVDTLRHTLTLARDPFGIKPLFLRRFPDGSVAFASELTSLSALASCPAVRVSSVTEFLHFGALGRGTTPFEDTSALVPNSWTRFTAGTESSAPASQISGLILENDRPFTRPAPGERVGPATVLTESVGLHLRSDVPTALLLSAGLDSGMLASAARRGGHHLRCFTVKVDGVIDESEGAAATALEYGHEHEVVPARLGPGDVDAFFASMQRPTIDGLNTFFVCKAVHQRGYRVALSGLGGDEAIAGYPHMRYFPLLRLLAASDHTPVGQFTSRFVSRTKVAELIRPGGPREARSYDELFRRVLHPEVARELTGCAEEVHSGSERVSGAGHDTAALIDVEIDQYLQRTLLPDADAFSMRWSVELRVPFVDVAFFQAASGAARPLRGKAPLVKSIGDAHLRRLLGQKKRGFSLPMATWLADGPLRGIADQARAADAPVWDYVDPRRWKEVMADEPPGRWASKWTVVVLNRWLEQLRSRELACD